MNSEKWYRWGAITLAVAGGAFALYLLCRYALVLFLPFIIAFLLATLTRKAALRFSRHSRIPEKVAAVLFTVLTLFGAGAAVYLLVGRLLGELQHLLTGLLRDIADPEGKLSEIFGFLKGLLEKLPLDLVGGNPWLEELVGDPGAFFAERLQNWLVRVSEEIPAALLRLLTALPAVLLFSLVTLISCFYFALEYDAVIAAVRGLLPDAWREKLPLWRRRLGEAAGRYVRAYLLIFLMTFGELFLGFVLLRTEYAFLLALLVAFLDILPVLGVGTFLVPFALIAFITGETARGVGLLILYAVITVVRQIAEPHLVGKSLGLHPILMLMTFYIGVKLFGFVGLIAGPVLAVILKLFYDKRQEKTAER